MQKTSRSHLSWILGVAVVSRIAFNTARRFLYPFAPALSRGMGVPLSCITSLIAVNQATTLLGALLAPLGDSQGYRRMMLIGLALLTLGMALGGILPFYSIILLAVFCAGLAKSLFDPAFQAYIGQQVPFERRGAAVGLAEMSWAGSSLIGIPVAGFLIDRFHWRAPFFALSAFALGGFLVLKQLLPKDSTMPVHHPGARPWHLWRRLLRERAAVGALGYALCINAANDVLFVVYGAWLEQAFGLSILAVGLSTTVIGLAEFFGESLTVSFADRLGLKRALFLGMLLSGASYLLLPLSEYTLSLALVALFLVFLTFEFTVVTSLSLFTEIVPELRATMMSGYYASAGLGRIAGTLLGGMLWQTGRIGIVGGAAACISLLALSALVWGLRTWQQASVG